ncbi:MAG: UDP-N-acetyl-D-mannosamine dehydrogenase [Myxococcales bacterium]|nr:UDP-N-acetyl-D-mannosamine dehydrogenase [Myxococcales bacterium]
MDRPGSGAAGEPPFDVCVIGLGYVGLPTAAVLATRGLRVAGVDLREDVVATINAGAIHIVEPELDALVRAAVAAGTLRAHLKPVPASAHLICVPTPLGPDQSPGLDHVDAAARALAPVLRRGDLVILESTVPPGTTRDVVGARIRERGLAPGEDVYVAHAPERVLPGAVIREVVENERVVGGLTDACTERAAAFYERFVSGEVHRASAETAELVKLAENAFRDVNIAYANELANVCDHLGLSAWQVIGLANRHPRVNILRPGPGVGGHCIAVDPWFIAASAPEHTPLIQTARRINDARPAQVIDQVHRAAAAFIAAHPGRERPRVALLGLSYKPDIDDLRESPALAVARGLRADDRVEVLLVEPHLAASPIDGLALHPAERALDMADIAVILVAHRAFRRLPRELLPEATIDCVGLFA